MVGVAVDDQHVVELAVARLLGGMREELGGVEFFDRYAPAAISNEVHGVSLSFDAFHILAEHRRQPVLQLCHIPSSKT